MAQTSGNQRSTCSEERNSSQLYASLVGPLLGVYYPLPLQFNNAQCRAALNTSRLKNLWHSVYTAAEVQRQIAAYGGIALDAGFADKLDYDSHIVAEWAGVGV
jgi:hypothetical protein